ncbi:TetR/AcrR family transcriptional regulator [Glycomyces tenuis]|uniref:TetR/AcrR family transcriptional regulator n=1 Tax=Glycomyces tenuis TaxID=58116 RepID=UPI00041AC9A1|nr:TetR family transcriptional regulator [Glycomyces tenuis]
MPPPNAQRRGHLADAAITVLAERGSHGLTHRAVDATAAVPNGTTSRYFRTREALVSGVVERITARINDRVQAFNVRPLDPDHLEAALVAILTLMVSEDARDALALFELHLEGTRNPRLRETLTASLNDRRDLLLRQCRAAGLGLDEADAMQLEMSVLGIVFTTLTTGTEDKDPKAAVRTAVRALLSRRLHQKSAVPAE